MTSVGPSRYLLVLPPALLALALYGSSLAFPFQFDDSIFLRDDNVTLARWSAFLWPPSPRILVWFSFTAQFSIWGPDPAPFRLLNLLLHSANSLLAVLLLFKIQELPGGLKRPGSWREPAAAGLIFALHPLHIESVVYIYQRSTLMAAFFCLLALLLWAHRPSTGLEAAALVCFLLAVLSKEYALVLPLVLWAWDVYRSGRFRPCPALAASLASSFLVGGLLLWWGVHSGATSFGAPGESLTYARTQVEVFWRYVKLFVLPLGQTVDPHVEAVQTWLSPAWWIRVALLGGVVGAIGWTFPRHRRLSFWLLFSLLWLLPTSSLIPSPDFMFEHRTYVSLLGFSGTLGILLSEIPMSIRTWRAVVALIVLGLGLLTWQRIQIWKSPESLWEDASVKSPGKYRPVYNLGTTLMKTSPARAEDYLSKAIQLDPTLPLAYRSLGQLKWDRGNVEDARQLLETALAQDPDHRETLLAVGRLRLLEDDFFGAEQLLKKAVNEDPTDWQARYLLGQLYYRFGLIQKALEEAEAGLARHPRQAGLRVLLADCVRRQHNWGRAIELYEESLRDFPRNSSAYLGLAEAYARSGRSNEALQAAHRAAATAQDPAARDRALGLVKMLESR